MVEPEQNSTPYKIFNWILSHRVFCLLLGFGIIIAMGSFAPKLTKDTRADAFLAEDNPALIYRDKVKQLFGLSDPIVIALIAPDSIFTKEGLTAVRAISDSLKNIPNIDPDRITSLATENNIVGTSEGLDVSPFYEGDIDQLTAKQVQDAIRDFPLYQGTLVSVDETATLVVAELLDQAQAEQTYQAILEALDQIPLHENLQLHVAGEGAVAGFLGGYIDSDAKRLNPLAAVIITIVLFIAFRRFGSTIMANVIIAASAVITIGSMAAAQVPFFVITNALPVILIGIAVADSIHIYSEYFERRSYHPDESIKDSIIYSMIAMWRPITLTTLTTAAGFLGLYFAAYMPPFKYFGLFTAIGVSAAWVYSLLFLPAAMGLLKTEVNPKLAKKITSTKRDAFASFMVMLGKLTLNHSRSIVIASIVIIGFGLVAASQLRVDDERINTFHPSEPLYLADKQVNQRFHGTYYLDVVIETQQEEGLFDPNVLKKIEALQEFALSLPNVQGAVSIVDYLKQMNRSLNEGNPDFYQLPEDRDLIAQYFLLYAASGNPTDFQEEVDYNYQMANARLMLNNGAYSQNRPVVEALENYIAHQFNDNQVRANLSGRVYLSYHWIKDLGASHFFGMAIALALVLIVSALLFGSLSAGLFSLMPVAASILLVYSTMVILQIPLGIGTSMFAAVAIGLGVDFAIHTIDRIRTLYREHADMNQVFQHFYPTTGRALLLNLLALALGFGVLISSKVVPLNNFGTIVALSVTVSFLFSMTVLPALIKLLKPKFITEPERAEFNVANGVKAASIILAFGLVSLFYSTPSEANTLPDGRWVAEQIVQVEDGEQRTGKLSMTMTDKNGKVRNRETINYRKYYGDEKRTVLFYLSPRNVKNTGFLTYDYPQTNLDDDQWLYLPALRKARRISASDRGDYFLGTDFTYEEIKKEGKFELSDYEFTSLEKVQEGDQELILLEAKPINEAVAEELGYGKIHTWVDSSNWIVTRAEYWDTALNKLKSLQVRDIRKVQNIWTRHELEIFNHKTGHSTLFQFSEVDYQTPVQDRLFTRQALSQGVPR